MPTPRGLSRSRPSSWAADGRHLRSVYIDTSAYEPSRYPPQLVSFLRGHGRREVLFGSNSPMILPGDCTAQLGELGLDAETRRAFLYDDAARVFGPG
ncbi:MAG: amidohydrolase family protein [Sandaracinaceae bacterium]|nr:amidohydrolase family protein [Sandaracinaceae bacterium]